MDQFYKVFYRPDLVSAKLREDYNPVNQAAAKTDIQKVLAGGAPPDVAFVSPKPLQADNIELTVELTDRGGGIGRLEWEINGETTDMTEKPEKGENGASLSVPKKITLSPGENNIRVKAYNARNEIASAPAAISLVR